MGSFPWRPETRIHQNHYPCATIARESAVQTKNLKYDQALLSPNDLFSRSFRVIAGISV